jgi:hypothetical protein
MEYVVISHDIVIYFVTFKSEWMEPDIVICIGFVVQESVEWNIQEQNHFIP